MSESKHDKDCFLVLQRAVIMDRQGDKKPTGVPDSYCTCGLTPFLIPREDETT